MTRRELLAQTGVAAMGAAAFATTTTQASAADQPARAKNEPFGYCLNTSTIRGQKLPLVEEIEIAAKAGYNAVEPWIGKIEEYMKTGGSLKDLAKRIRDHGMTVESAIGFAQWIVNDDAQRAKGMEQAKIDLRLVAEIGGKRLAAPPAGAQDRTDVNLFKAAERYRALLELGDQAGVVPQVEVWGFSKTLGKLSETALVAVESKHPKACILPDVYHLYKGGSDFEGLRLLSGDAVQVIHMNDYPADPPRDKIADKDRVYPGDGVAPLTQILRDMHAAGFRGYLSLELFNVSYWGQDALTVARTGLEKMRAAVQRAFA
jgi:2-keto-myo-inositol isomerase